MIESEIHILVDQLRQELVLGVYHTINEFFPASQGSKPRRQDVRDICEVLSTTLDDSPQMHLSYDVISRAKLKILLDFITCITQKPKKAALIKQVLQSAVCRLTVHYCSTILDPDEFKSTQKAGGFLHLDVSLDGFLANVLVKTFDLLATHAYKDELYVDAVRSSVHKVAWDWHISRFFAHAQEFFDKSKSKIATDVKTDSSTQPPVDALALATSTAVRGMPPEYARYTVNPSHLQGHSSYGPLPTSSLGLVPDLAQSSLGGSRATGALGALGGTPAPSAAKEAAPSTLVGGVSQPSKSSEKAGLDREEFFNVLREYAQTHEKWKESFISDIKESLNQVHSDIAQFRQSAQGIATRLQESQLSRQLQDLQGEDSYLPMGPIGNSMGEEDDIFGTLPPQMLARLRMQPGAPSPVPSPGATGIAKAQSTSVVGQGLSHGVTRELGEGLSQGLQGLPQGLTQDAGGSQTFQGVPSPGRGQQMAQIAAVQAQAAHAAQAQAAQAAQSQMSSQAARRVADSSSAAPEGSATNTTSTGPLVPAHQTPIVQSEEEGSDVEGYV